ncbi:hypothetical protein AB0I69_43140 [Streptomyces sp. NPDC050508]
MADDNNNSGGQGDQQSQGQGCAGCRTTTGGCTDPNRHGLM